jgi:hypothetical protein
MMQGKPRGMLRHHNNNPVNPSQQIALLRGFGQHSIWYHLDAVTSSLVPTSVRFSLTLSVAAEFRLSHSQVGHRL